MEQLPADRQAYFTQKAAANKWTVLAVFAAGALIVAYESARVCDLGFDALRVLVYVPMSVALLAAGVVVPVLNRRRYQRVVRQYAFNEDRNKSGRSPSCTTSARCWCAKRRWAVHVLRQGICRTGFHPEWAGLAFPACAGHSATEHCTEPRVIERSFR